VVDYSDYIRIGFFNNFKSHDSVLFSVNKSGLIELENIFLQLSNGLEEFDFSNLKYLDTNFRIGITAFSYNENLGLNQIAKGKFEWHLTKEKWLQFTHLLSYWNDKDKGGHHYLDAETGDINPDSLQVVFSLYEYPLSFWEEHFQTCND
jgi:hypothetical protein